MKKVYQIADDDFEILTEPQTQEDIQKQGWIYRLGDILGTPAWAWRSWTGRLTAIILATSAIKDLYEATVFLYENAPKVVAWTYDNVPKGWMAILPKDTDWPQERKSFPLNQLPQGTGIYPSYQT